MSLSTSSTSSSTENSAPRKGLLDEGARLTGPGRRGVCGVMLCGRVLEVLGIEPVATLSARVAKRSDGNCKAPNNAP